MSACKPRCSARSTCARGRTRSRWRSSRGSGSRGGAHVVDPRGRDQTRQEAGRSREEGRQSQEEKEQVMARPLSGPRLPPARGNATHLVVLVHGYGADGNDLISLAGHWQSLLPTTEFVAPNAPDRVPGAPSGFQWFGLTRMDPQELSRGVAAAGPLLDGFLDQELSRLGLSADRLALVGFSQGTMLALHVGLHRPAKPAAIVGFSGLLAAPPPAGSPAP